ncbi:MAG: hypothetical protein SYNGOMJ08_00481 [Candidatus Syntrophoarchaeum sp. GoM_oil]|nr:MAG: hypothetical protein SYNGOMJ08_00481 [Candidatus Syntrophoarchaeum sp. GoM_oil]
MVKFETDLNGHFLVREEEINFIYEGPSFEEKMEISHLTSQLKSTEFVIKEIVSELYKQKKNKNQKYVKIYLKLKKGSFQEIIFILFNTPVVATIIGGCIVALFTYFLTKKKNNEIIDIGNLINNYSLAKNLNLIVVPLEKEKDEFKLISSNPEINITLSLEDKIQLSGALKELKEKVAIEIYKEEFFGYLSVIYLDKEKYRFTLEGTDRAIPAIFDNKPSLKEIKEILGFRLRINARATYEEKELKKIEIENYEIKRRENLNDFIGGKNG